MAPAPSNSTLPPQGWQVQGDTWIMVISTLITSVLVAMINVIVTHILNLKSGGNR